MPEPTYLREIPGVSFVSPEHASVRDWLARFGRVASATGVRPQKWPPQQTTRLAGVGGATDFDPAGLYALIPGVPAWVEARRVAQQALTDVGAQAVIAGGALGWDQVVAAAALKLGLPLLLACPFETQDGFWPKKSAGRTKWLEQLGKADLVVIVTPASRFPAEASAQKRAVNLAMDARNQFMVQHAHVVLTFSDGTPGGTANCIRDCRKAGREMHPCWEAYRAALEVRGARAAAPEAPTLPFR